MPSQLLRDAFSNHHIVLALLLAAVLSLQQRLTILVELDTRDHALRRVDTNGNRLAICLVTGDTLDMNYPLLTVDLNDLALPIVVMAANNHHLVIFADW